MKIDMLPLTHIPHLDSESHHILIEKFMDTCKSSIEDCHTLVNVKQTLPTLLHLKSKLAFMLEAAKLICIEHADSDKAAHKEEV